jgi:hypothetical protein
MSDRPIDPEPSVEGRTSHQWLAGGGELGELMRTIDWSATPLGPPDDWPQSLRSAVSILLPSKAQICLFWVRISSLCITMRIARRSD